MADDRHGQMRAIGTMLPRVAGAALGKRGLGDAQLIQNWAAIVGERLARATCPEKITYARNERRDGTLSLAVTPGVALEIQHSEPVILERINAFFGYRAVARLSLRQTLTRRAIPRETPIRALAEPERQALDGQVGAVGDEALREALKRLGTAIARTARK